MLAAPRYRLVRAVGSGGMAQVYEAIATGAQGFERRVAIKRILPQRAGDEGMRRMFLDEARIASRLHHGNIVQVLDFGLLDGCEFLVMEYVDGLDARAAARRSQSAGIPIVAGVALHVVAEVAHALAYLAASGVVHRDVSPQNLLLSWAGDVKLGDFGIALAAKRDERTATGIVKGKRSYMAPEQAAGSDVGPPADVYALGATLYDLLTGEPPSEDEGALEDAGLPDEVEQLVELTLMPDPSDRPDAAEVAGAAGRLAATLLGRDGRSALAAWLAELRPLDQQPASKLDDVMGLCVVPLDAPAPERRFTVSRVTAASPKRMQVVEGSPAASEPREGRETARSARPIASEVAAPASSIPVTTSSRRATTTGSHRATTTTGSHRATTTGSHRATTTGSHRATTASARTLGAAARKPRSRGATALLVAGIVAVLAGAGSLGAWGMLRVLEARSRPAPAPDGAPRARADAVAPAGLAPPTTQAPAVVRETIALPTPVAPVEGTPTAAGPSATPGELAPTLPEIPELAGPSPAAAPETPPPRDAPRAFGWVRVTGAWIRGAPVRIDGRPVGTAPLRVRVAEGSHRVVAGESAGGPALLDERVTVTSAHTELRPLLVTPRGVRAAPRSPGSRGRLFPRGRRRLLRSVP